MRAAAHDKLPDYPKDTVAVLLYSEQQTVVKDKGDIETRYRYVYKLLRAEARGKYDAAVIYFDNETKITFLKAWTIVPDGREIEVKEKDAAEVGVSNYEVFSDIRAKVLKFPEANPGAVVGYEYVQKHRPFLFEDDWRFQEKVPVRRARFVLQLPSGWEFTTYWANYADPKVQDGGTNQSVWELHDVPGVEIEPDMPPWDAVAGRLGLKYFPRDPALRAKTMGSWKDLGIWYKGLTESSRAVSPQIQQKVAELTAGITDPLEKMKVLTSYVQGHIRYAAIEIGIGGLQPHPAKDVFAHQYGDCKDKATLLGAMLQEIGVDSYYVVIDTERGIVHPDFPSMQFNHVVLAIRLPEKVDGGVLYATVNHPTLGRLLFFDPTNERVPFGYLPSYLQDNYGLVVTPQGGELLSLPLLPASTNRLMRTGTMDLSAAGNLTGEVKEIRWGGPAEERRQQLLEVPPAKRSKVFEDFLGGSLSNFTLTSATIGNLEKDDENLLLSYKFFAQGYAKSAGDLLVVRPRVVGAKGSSLLSGKPRKYPIEFQEATRQDDQIDITIPPGYVVDELPEPVKAKCAYGSYTSEVKAEGNQLHYKRSYEIRGILVPTQNLNEVRDFFKEIAASERASAVLRRAN
jgi:transglutaminase-like putative cysteine protease